MLLDVATHGYHPADKQPWAASAAVGGDVRPEYSPTVPRSGRSRSVSLPVVELDHAVGLATSDGATPGAFEVSTDKRLGNGSSHHCWESDHHCGNGIVAVRYAWSDVPADANVVNADGLPTCHSDGPNLIGELIHDRQKLSIIICESASPVTEGFHRLVRPGCQWPLPRGEILLPVGSARLRINLLKPKGVRETC